MRLSEGGLKGYRNSGIENEARPAMKACEVGLLHAGVGLPCRPHPAATQLVSQPELAGIYALENNSHYFIGCHLRFLLTTISNTWNNSLTLTR